MITIPIEFRQLTHLTTKPEVGEDENDAPRRIQLANWSKTKDSLVFVAANDIYFLRSVSAPIQRITFDGNHYVYNGVTDWVYEEEMVSRNEIIINISKYLPVFAVFFFK